MTCRPGHDRADPDVANPAVANPALAIPAVNGPDSADLVLLATNPDVGARLRRMFGVNNPWTQARLDRPQGPQLAAAAALANQSMPERLAARLCTPRVAVVLRDPLRQCQRHFDENVAAGNEWRPFEVALAHDAALAIETKSLVRNHAAIDDFDPLFAYISLANHEQWLPLWRQVFNDRLIVVNEGQGHKIVATIASHFGTEPEPTAHLGGLADATPTDGSWEYLRELLDA